MIQKELAILFRQESKTLFRGVMISVTIVRMSPDLKVAKVFLSFFGTKDSKAELKHINEIQGDIRRRLGMVMRNQLKYIPELHFYQDDSLEYAAEINELLK